MTIYFSVPCKLSESDEEKNRLARIKDGVFEVYSEKRWVVCSTPIVPTKRKRGLTHKAEPPNLF